jgi:hypothetical protein
MSKRFLCAFLVSFLFFAAFGSGQEVSDITVPTGFRLEKVLDLNPCQDAQRIAFLPSADLLLTSMMWRILQITPAGAVTTRAKFLVNQGPNPLDILVTSGGEILFSNYDAVNNLGLYRLESDQPVLVTPPGWGFSYLTGDDNGNLYAVGWRVPYAGTKILKLSDADRDGFYEDVQILVSCSVEGLRYRGGYLYVVVPEGGIYKFNTNGTQVGQPIIEGLSYPYDLAVDSQGNCYTLVYAGSVVDGYATLNKRDLIKVSPAGNKETIIEDMTCAPRISISPDDVLYISEYRRGVVSKVVNGSKVDVTQDTGQNGAAGIAFDMLNRPYVSSFRSSQLKRLDPVTRTVEAVTPRLGEGTQGFTVDDNGRFYLSEYLNNGFFIVDPLSGAIERRTVPWTRRLWFDAFGRLVLVMTSLSGPTPDDLRTTLGIYDLTTGQVTPYVFGNDLSGFLFDKNQNLYARHRRFDGIIKVNVPENPTDPPFNTLDTTPFYDLTSKHLEIRYSDLSTDGKLLIPIPDAGEVVLGEVNGTWSVFASGFDWPGYVKFDQNGVLYVACIGGVYRIIGSGFVVPAVSQRLLERETTIREKVSNKGLANALCKIVDGAIASLKRGNIISAIRQIEAFTYMVSSQSGKNIPAGDAESFISWARIVIEGLKLL